jgi:hypothetical protein
MEDNLWAEYDLRSRKVRKLALPKRVLVTHPPHSETMNEGFTVSDKSAAE